MNLPIEEIKRLYYEEGLSTKEVGKKLGFTVWQVIRLMKRNNLPRRDQAETHRLAYFGAQLSFNVKEVLTTEENNLKTAGLMLYLGEGSKGSNGTLDLANSNPLTIIVFLRMLIELYGIDESRLRVLLYCYGNQDLTKLINYWVKVTGISKKQFTKPYVRQDFLPEKKDKMPYGLVHIRYNDKKLILKIRSDIQELCECLTSRDAGVVNRK